MAVCVDGPLYVRFIEDGFTSANRSLEPRPAAEGRWERGPPATPYHPVARMSMNHTKGGREALPNLLHVRISKNYLGLAGKKAGQIGQSANYQKPQYP